jgi:AhpD family alkylhydroperoxidase
VPVGLKPLIAIVASTAAGCRYCQAHETVDAKMRGVDEAKIAQIWNFERSELYTDAERAALRFARDASVIPNAVTPQHFEELRHHWDEGEIIEILAVIGLFGFLNRWNDSMATDLEEIPTAFADRTIGSHGWEPGKHG